MKRIKLAKSALSFAFCSALVAGMAYAQSAPPQSSSNAAAPAAAEPPALEPKAIEILKATSARLAAAHSMKFTAVETFESLSRQGVPLVYANKFEVTMQRPDKLRVILAGDGPASEFYDDGKTVMAFAPAENLVAITEAQPTIDATLESVFHSAAIYFPAQVWVGTEDKLPRGFHAIYLDDPDHLRHNLIFSDWQIDPTVSTDAFTSSTAASAKHMPFAHPDAQPGPGVRPPNKTTPPSAQ
jgi:hypothetical protein